MSGAEGSSGRRGLLASLMGTLRRSSARPEQPKPVPEDLGLKTLRHAYGEYAKIEHPVEKERQLHRIIPLFCQNCSKFSVQELETRFPEVLDFAEQISLLFVRHVTQIAHPQITSRAGAGLSLLKYFESVDEDEVGSTGGVGLMILRAIHILSNGSDMIVTAMMTSNLCSVLVQCINLFLELPRPGGLSSESRSRSGSSASPATPTKFRTPDEVSSSPVSRTFSMMMSESSRPPSSLHSLTPTPGSAHSNEMSERQALERLLRSVLDRLVRHMSAVSDLIQRGDLSLLFGAISRPCPVYNKMWRKAAADCLIAICRFSLSSEVIDYIHRKGCIMFCMRNIQKATDQPPLDVVESIATIFSCLKDSAEISQVLLEDFSNCRGYKFLHDYLLYLERKTSDEAREVLRNAVLLVQGLVMAGFLTLEPTLTDGGPFQDPNFQIPAPLDPNHTVRNKDAFIVLQDVFIASKTSHLGITIIDAVLNIFQSDTSNYFIVQQLQSLSYFIERITEKKEDVQAHVFKLFEFVMLEINYVATAELTSIGLLLTQRDHPQTLTLVLNFLLRLISYSAKYKMIFAQVGILTMMINALKVYAKELKEGDQQTEISTVPSGGVSSPSLPLEDVQGAEEEYVFLLMECLRATIEGSEQNGEVFRENGGTKCALTLVNYNKPRRLVLRLLTQLILLKDGSVDFSALLDLLNQSSQTAVRVKAEVFQTILRIFQLDSSQKGVFRDVCGFHYLISVLASLIGSLAPRRSEPWIGVPRLDILHLVQLIFAVLTSAMHDDPANRSYFEINIRFQSFTAPLLLLGCFDNNATEFLSLSSSDDLVLHSGSFTSFESEFKTWHPPSKDLSQDSAIYSASEVFRFLRDMSLGIQSHQSTSLINAMTIGLAREKNFYGAPPVTAARQKAGNSTLHLEHPGAVLCMVDLLPAAGIDEAYADDGSSDDGRKSVGENDILSNEPLSPLLPLDNQIGDVPDVIDNHSSSSGKERKKHELEELDVEYKDLEKEVNDDECHMTRSEARSWAIFLQERVVSEIYSMALSERNQQDLCQIGLPQRILDKCSAVLSIDSHPLHEALERTFEKLSYQSLTPSDFRSFLRLGNPLCCSLNDITMEDLQSGKYSSQVGRASVPTPSATPEVLKRLSTSELEATANQPPLIDLSEPNDNKVTPSVGTENEPIKVESESTNKNAPFGGSLSLARVQSLVSMTTPRDGNQEGMIRNPPFVEFDLSIDGFACLFLPSVFPMSISQASSSQTLQSPAAISGSTSGVGTGSERPFPPSNGLTFSCWLHFTRCSRDEKSLIGLLTLAQTLYLKDRKLHHLPCLRIYLHPDKKQLVATTCQPGPGERKNSVSDDVTVKADSKDKMDEAVFRCPQLFQEHCWRHIVVVINKGIRGRAKVTLFINGQLQETHKMTYIHSVYVNSSAPLLPYPNENTPYLINALIGTHVTQRSVTKLTYRLGSIFLFEDPLLSNVVQHIYTLGPSYYGAFQAPVLQDRLVSSLVPGSRSDPLPPLIPEDKVVFGLLVTCPLLKTVLELSKAYCSVDVSTIARELSLTEQDNITPITLLHNSAAHLLGPSRTLGAIMCGYSGIRFFEPQPLRSLISSVGGTSVMLGLVAMATTVDNLYASMKALVCIIGDNQVALKEMERTGGFQVLGMLLHSKAHLINSHILHLTYTLVGTVDSEQSASISNPIAFRDLLANMVIWRATSEYVQRSLFNHFYDLLSRNSNRVANAEQMLKMKLVSILLFHLIMENLCIKTIKLICNVLSTLIALKPDQEDITRIGQLLATTLPSNRAINENSIDLYDAESFAHSSEHDEVDTNLMDNAQEQFGRFSGTEGKQRRAIVLRNILLEVILSLLVQEDGLNSSFTRQFSISLGFDWLMLFMDASIHAETVSRAVRILIQLLTDPILRVKFHEGDIFGGWVQGFESISSDMSQMLSTSVSHFNPLKPSTNSQLSGASVLSYILPHHAHLSHVFLLLVASLLGKSSTDIPFSSQFNTETLEDLFSIGDTTNMAQQFKIFTDAAYVLLALTRSLLHQETSDPSSLTCAVDLIKFLTRLYRHVPEFTKFASSQEFIEALASTLFPPPLPPNKTTSTTTDTVEQEIEKGETAEWILIETQELPGVAGQDQREAILKNPNNLAVCTVVKLLRTIAVNGFSSAIQTKESAPMCPIFERVLTATPAGISTDLQNQYQTLILHSVVEYLKSGNEDILVLLRSNPYLSQSMDRSMLGLSVFCSRLVDKVWQEVYLKPVSELYSFFYALVEQARKTPKELPLGDLQRCLNRVILYQVSTVPASEESQKQLMDTLCMFSSQAHCIFDDTNFDNEFLECLTFCLLKIVFAEKVASRYEHASSPERHASDTSLNSSGEGSNIMRPGKKAFAGYVPGSIAMMKSGANRLWTKMLEYKRRELEHILSAELPTPNSNREALPFPGGPMAATNSAYLRLQNCEHFLTDSLIKSWDLYIIGERSSLSIDSAQKDGRMKSLTGTLWPASRISRKRKGVSISSEAMVQDYVETLCPLLVLAAQKYFETMLRNYQRNEDYRLRYAVSEWSKIEYELTRERGLWGPEIPSRLDKWMLDTVEGPSRMRKRLCRNHNFFHHYPYRVRKAKVKSKHQQPSSHDSELLYKRELLFQRPTLLTTSSVITTSKEMPRIMSVSVMEKEPPAGASQSPAPSPAHMSLASSNKMNVFTHPDSDDPIAQTIYRMIEPEDKVSFQYQCATLNGLDSRDGVLLLGNSHFYVIEGLTINKYAEIVDIETAHEESYLPVVPLHLRTDLDVDTTTKRQISIQCIKWSYDTIREIHKRRYLLRRCAIEVFSSDGRNHFLIFHSQKRDKIYQQIHKSSKSSLADSQFVAGIHPEADPEQSTGILSVLTGEKSLPERWANGEITNFQYLMHLNTLAGRSYNDLMQYPIFPWVLANYSSETLDLTNPSTFRDFSKPMGAQDPVRLKRFIERYKYFEDPTGENTPAYYYGTHYSSAMIVASYLIRMEPFTQHFLKLQGGHFDLPDRLFHSIPDAWKSASETNMADIKELIPEFFYLPEFICNTNRFELGTKQSGVALNDIILPPWAKGDPHEFIRMHREALECDYVSAHLHEWIDLIFGYKQTGEEALKAHNIFHHLFYEGAVDIDKIEDPVKRNATISFIHNFGQMPKQLFRRPHRQRKVFISTPTAIADSSATTSISIVDSMRVFYKNLVQLMPSRDPIKEIRGEVSQMVSVTDKIPTAVEKNKFLLPPNFNRYFMWGFPDYSARIATVEGDKVSSVFEGLHEGRILCSAAADDNILLTGGESTVVCVWKVQYSGPKDRSKAQLQLKHTLYGHTGPVTCLAASTSYNLILSGSKDKTCILWDINRFTFVQQLSGHSNPVTIVTINQLNGNIVTCTRNQIRLWTVNGTLLAETDLFYSNNFRLLSCTVSELFDWDRENVIVTGSSDGIVRLWVLEYVQEEEELRRRKSSSRRSLTLSESDFDPAVHGDRHLPVVQSLRRSITPPTLPDIIEGQTSGTTVNGTNVQPISYSNLDSIIRDFDTHSTGAQLIDTAIGGTHEGLHSNKTSSLSNLPSNERDSTLGVSDLPILSTSMPPSTSVGDLIDLSSTGTTQPNLTGMGSAPLLPNRSTGSAVSDNVFETTQSDTEDTKTKEDSGTDDVFGSEKEKESGKVEAGSTRGDKATTEDKNPTYTQLMAEQRRKTEELKLKAGKWIRKLTMVHQLTMHTSFHRKDNDNPASVTSLCISKDHRKLFVGDAKGRIFSWSVSDNLGGMMEHWLKDEAINNCMKCNVEFTFTERKHHCRDCGKIFCAKCSAFESEIERLRINKKVRICGDCFAKLNSRTK